MIPFFAIVTIISIVLIFPPVPAAQSLFLSYVALLHTPRRSVPASRYVAAGRLTFRRPAKSHPVPKVILRPPVEG